MQKTIDDLLTWGLERTGKLASTFKNSTMVQHHIKGGLYSPYLFYDKQIFDTEYFIYGH